MDAGLVAGHPGGVATTGGIFYQAGVAGVVADRGAVAQADLHVAGGFYKGAARLLGLGDMSYRVELGDDGARFDLAWS